MKPYDYYSDAGEYPVKPNKPIMAHNATSSEAKTYADLLVSYEKQLELHKAKMNAYREKKASLHIEFKHDLFQEHGVSDNPKAEMCFEIACEDAHAYGYQEVANRFSV